MAIYNHELSFLILNNHIIFPSDEDLGKYSCKAKNSLGSTDGEITLYGETFIFYLLQSEFISPKSIVKIVKYARDTFKQYKINDVIIFGGFHFRPSMY